MQEAHKAAVDSMIEQYRAGRSSTNVQIRMFWETAGLMKTQLQDTRTEYHIDEAEFAAEFEDVVMADSSLDSIDIKAITSSRTRQVTFGVAQSNEDIESRDLPPPEASMSQLASEQSLKSILSSGTEDTLWSETSESDILDKLELYTTSFKGRFLDPIFTECREILGLRISDMHEAVKVSNGKAEFTSSNDCRYVFAEEDGRSGGAEVFGTEDKRRNTSSTAAYKAKLKIQVAGEMLATAMHRQMFTKVADNLHELIRQQPQIVSAMRRDEETVLYLVFTHRSLNLVSASFPRAYLVHLKRGYLDDTDKVTFNWTKRFRLDKMEDLEDAIRLTMNMILNLGEQWKTGEYFWRPFCIDGIWINT